MYVYLSHIFSLQSVFYNLSLYFPLKCSRFVCYYISHNMSKLLDSFCAGDNFTNSMRQKSCQIYLIFFFKRKSVQVPWDCEGKKVLHSHRQAHAYIHNDSGQSQQLALNLPIAFSCQKQNLFLITFHWDFFSCFINSFHSCVLFPPLFIPCFLAPTTSHTPSYRHLFLNTNTHCICYIYPHTHMCKCKFTLTQTHTFPQCLAVPLCSPFPFIPSLSAFAWKMFELFGALRCRWNRIWISRHLSPRPSPKSPSAAVAYA